MRFVITIAVLFLTTLVVFGQQRTVKGRLISVEDKTPLPGFSVREPGTPNATVTDANGEFVLTVNSHPTIILFPQCFSQLYVEYKEDEDFKEIVLGLNQKGQKHKLSRKTWQKLLKSNPTRELYGTVLYKKSRKPAYNCEVRVKGTYNTVYSDDEGRFVITVPNNTMIELEFRKGAILQIVPYDMDQSYRKVKLKLSGKI